MGRPRKIQDDQSETYGEVRAEPVKQDGAIFTYVGAGTDIPDVINFMGVQEFVRGEPTLVTNQQVLRKIISNPSFIQGEADRKKMHDDLQEARARAEATKERNKAAVDIVNKRNSKFK